MSNWQYANQVPTQKWRNAMTIPRELTLNRVSGQILVASEPVKELESVYQKTLNLGSKFSNLPQQYVLKLNPDNDSSYSIVLSNDAGDQLVIGYDNNRKQYYIDRSKSGKVDFNTAFAKIAFSPRFVNTAQSNLKLIIDASSVELFADDGLTVMTSVFFPTKPYDHIELNSIKGLQMIPLKSIWQ
ncbi:MAG: glycoside hydrolase family 32 protein [Mucilaginibacter sp.]|nr:glycoside hydrolase family 32 protein [Mucilaginibacter sp.]